MAWENLREEIADLFEPLEGHYHAFENYEQKLSWSNTKKTALTFAPLPPPKLRKPKRTKIGKASKHIIALARIDARREYFRNRYPTKHHPRYGVMVGGTR